jgi:L-amino acid N-acyltransferase YncA
MLEEEYAPRRVLPAHLRPAPVEEAAFDFTVRQAVERDLPHVLEIYNHYVKNSTVTFDDSVMTLGQLRRKFAKTLEKKIPFVVAESPSGNILGFAYVFPWKEKAAYRYSVENFIYLGPAATGKGLGKVLLGELIQRCKAAGLKEMVAVIADQGAEASIALHRDFGYKQTGHMGRVGFKFDRWLGTVFMQKSLK